MEQASSQSAEVLWTICRSQLGNNNNPPFAELLSWACYMLTCTIFSAFLQGRQALSPCNRETEAWEVKWLWDMFPSSWAQWSWKHLMNARALRPTPENTQKRILGDPEMAVHSAALPPSPQPGSCLAGVPGPLTALGQKRKTRSWVS